MTARQKAENACIEAIMRIHNKNRQEASHFLHRGIANGWFARDPKMEPLVVAYKNACYYSRLPDGQPPAAA
jgi:hypothetical protein